MRQTDVAERILFLIGILVCTIEFLHDLYSSLQAAVPPCGRMKQCTGSQVGINCCGRVRLQLSGSIKKNKTFCNYDLRLKIDLLCLWTPGDMSQKNLPFPFNQGNVHNSCSKFLTHLLIVCIGTGKVHIPQNL